PRQTLTGACRLRIRGLLSATAAREHVPEVIPLDLPKVELFVVVPTHVRSQKIEWETSLLQAVPLPDDLGAEQVTADHIAFRVTGPRYRAAIRQVEQRMGDPYVMLADYSVFTEQGGQFAGTAVFDIQPSGRQICSLEMPESCELVHVYVDGRSPAL